MPGALQVSLPWWAAYVGLPFLGGGRDRDGLDCWGLVRLVYAERFGIGLPEYGEIAANELRAVARAMDAAAAADPWLPVSAPREGDVCLMRSARGGRAIVHVGVSVNASGILHVERASASVVVPLNHYSIRQRIAGFRRYVA